MRVLGEGLAPRVQDGRDADRAAEVSRIAAEGEERLGGRPKQERVDHARIALRERIERMGQREDDVKVGNGEQVRTPGVDPAGTGPGLTRGAVPIPTRVEGETGGPAVVTRLPMPAQQRGAARRDRAERQPLDRREPMRAPIGVAMGPHDVPQREADRRDRGRRLYGDGTPGLARWRVESIQQIERRPGRDLGMPRQLEVPHRRTQMAVAQQPLDGVEVDARFEQMRRKAMPQRILTLPMNRLPRSFTTVTIPSMVST